MVYESRQVKIEHMICAADLHIPACFLLQRWTGCWKVKFEALIQGGTAVHWWNFSWWNWNKELKTSKKVYGKAWNTIEVRCWCWVQYTATPFPPSVSKVTRRGTPSGADSPAPQSVFLCPHGPQGPKHHPPQRLLGNQLWVPLSEIWNQPNTDKGWVLNHGVKSGSMRGTLLAVSIQQSKKEWGVLSGNAPRGSRVPLRK